MKKSRFYRRISFPLFSLLPVLILLSPLFFLASCADSEQRITNGDTMSRVLINLGTGSNSKSDRMAATAPTNITTITITVTGPGMTPIVQTLSSAPGTIDLSVPSGPARRFTAMVTTTDGIYTGTALASLPAGQTVSVPIVMRFGGSIGFKDEGTIDNPIYVPSTYSGDIPYVGSVNYGVSYYYTDPGSYDQFSITVKGMTDDVDLHSYGTDSGFSGQSPSQFGYNFCGRTKDEMVSEFFDGGFSIMYPDQFYYFVIDGSHTKRGAAYSLICKANNGEDATPPIGSESMRNYIQVGLPYNSRIELPTWPINYYASMVQPGTRYWVNMYDNDPASTMVIYNPFPTPVTSPLTAVANLIAYNVNGMVTDDFTLEVVTNEGTSLAPIDLFADDTLQTGRANYCMVGGGDPSYYRIAATGVAFNAYLVRVMSIRGNVGMEIYKGPSFESIDLVASSNEPDTVDETYSGSISLFPDGYIYVKVFNSNTSGSSFVLYAMGYEL